MKLVRPSTKYEGSYRTYLAEVDALGERRIPYQLARPNEDFEALVGGLHANAAGKDLPEGHVPNTTCWLIEEGQIVGVSNLRHRLTPFLERRGGHIGYSVRPSARARGVGTRLLYLTLLEARRLDLAWVLVTCAKDNVGSAGVIRANGGTLLSEELVAEENEIVQRYRVPVPPPCSPGHASLLESLGIDPGAMEARCLAFCPEATELVVAETDERGREHRLIPAAATAWAEMKAAAAKDGVAIRIVSAFRTIERQAEIVRAKLAGGADLDSILRVSAAPGFSEHHTGRAVDVTTDGARALEEEFEATDAFRWLSSEARRFGFRLSYPRGNPAGYAYEPWHWYFR